MNTEILSRLNGPKKQQWQQLLRLSGLEADEAWEQTVLVWEEDRLVAAGSRQENLLKCLAVDPAHQGEGLLATVLTASRVRVKEVNGKDLPNGRSVITLRFEVKNVAELDAIRNKLLNIRDVVGSRRGQN